MVGPERRLWKGCLLSFNLSDPSLTPKMSVAETARLVVILSVDEGVCCDDDNNRCFPSRIRFRWLASNISSFCVPVACPSNLLLQLFQVCTLK